MSNRDPKAASTSDRRSSNRRPLDDVIKIRLDTHELDGQASNLSSSGILFFTDDELKVTVEVPDGTGTKSYTGSLVRCERIKGNHRGWAVEFDRE